MSKKLIETEKNSLFYVVQPSVAKADLRPVYLKNKHTTSPWGKSKRGETERERQRETHGAWERERERERA